MQVACGWPSPLSSYNGMILNLFLSFLSLQHIVIFNLPFSFDSLQRKSTRLAFASLDTQRHQRQQAHHHPSSCMCQSERLLFHDKSAKTVRPPPLLDDTPAAHYTLCIAVTSRDSIHSLQRHLKDDSRKQHFALEMYIHDGAANLRSYAAHGCSQCPYDASRQQSIHKLHRAATPRQSDRLLHQDPTMAEITALFHNTALNIAMTFHRTETHISALQLFHETYNTRTRARPVMPTCTRIMQHQFLNAVTLSQ
eukprot:TRINITY_DN967_c0_g1_i2.p1 TRINITY_DN967_c0_g1~~TRINITY_DN967_c0_g1_i2.p1  ORF type:complete len:252 (+),score=-11.19 TRINITY_DN967_c0_g1_i2:106-861(+)